MSNDNVKDTSNKTDKPLDFINELEEVFSVLNEGPSWNSIDFPDINNFTLLGKLSASHLTKKGVPRKSGSDLVFEKCQDSLSNDREETVYALVLDNKFLLKVGSTTKTFKERVGSYNCGKSENRENGTCSTTNYYVLQSLLSAINSGHEIEVYAYHTAETKIQKDFDCWETAYSPAKPIEKSILTRMKKSKKFPIFCGQT